MHRTRRATPLAAVALFAVLCSVAVRAGPVVQLELLAEWGWGGEQKWEGAVLIEGGDLVSAEGYLMDPGERGVIHADTSRFEVESVTRGLTDGARFRVRGGLEAMVSMQIGPQPVQFALADVLDETKTFLMSDDGRKIVVWRDPADRLRIELDCGDLVLTPGEDIPLRLMPNPVTRDGVDVDAVVELEFPGVGTARRWTDTVKQGVPAVWRLSVPAPLSEGVYHLTATAHGRGLDGAEVRLPFVVVDPEWTPDRPAELGKRLVDRIDCTNPADSHPYLGAAETAVTDLPLGRFRVTSTKGQPAGSRTDVHGHMGWFAYRLRVAHPGVGHMLDVTYPGDAWQTVGVSIFEPDAMGELRAVHLDSGFHTGGEHRTSGQLETYSLVFWPRTVEPIVLVTNRRDGGTAAVREMRLHEVPAGLPALRVARPPGVRERLLGLYYEEPKVVENFGGPEARAGDRSVTDWGTFYQAGRHLVDYLRYTGMNAVLLQSHGYMSTLFPTDLTQHRYRYDTGRLATVAPDPVQKDQIELYLRLFARDGLHLIPSINFEQTIPRLEAMREPGADGVAEIDMVRHDGTVPQAHRRAGRAGMAPFYEPLHPLVQEAMIELVREVAQRYAGHKSFAGLSIQHRGLAFVQYPGLDYGYGDWVVNRFATETGIGVAVADAGPERFAKRYEWLTTHARAQWIDWRCRKLRELMLRCRDVLRDARPDLLLFVSYMNSLQSILVSDNVLTWVEAGKPMRDLFRVKGLDPAGYAAVENVVVTRPFRTGPLSRYLRRDQQRGYIRRDLQFMDEIDSLFPNGPQSGVLTFHEYFESRLRDFDDVAWMSSRTWLVGTIPPAGRSNLERFAHWMAALDASAVFDGGWQAPMGCEQQMREFAREFRPLPVAEFAALPVNIEPAVCRHARVDNRLFFYLVNRAPYPVRVDLTVEGKDVALTRLGTGAGVSGPRVRCDLPPFALRSFAASGAGRVVDAVVEVPAQELGRLERAVRTVVGTRTRWQAAQQAAEELAPVASYGFADTEPGRVPDGWSPLQDAAAWQVVAQERGRALQIVSAGDRYGINGPVFGVEQLTGLRVRARISGKIGSRFRLFVIGQVDGKFWSKFVEDKVGARVATFELVLPSLPGATRERFLPRLDIMGPGEVAVHELTVVPFAVDPETAARVLKTIAETEQAWRERRYYRVERFLDSYWDRLALRGPDG